LPGVIAGGPAERRDVVVDRVCPRRTSALRLPTGEELDDHLQRLVAAGEAVEVVLRDWCKICKGLVDPRLVAELGLAGSFAGARAGLRLAAADEVERAVDRRARGRPRIVGLEGFADDRLQGHVDGGEVD